MAQATISARIDAEDKRRFDEFCDTVGLTASALMNVFVKKVVREQRIPFSIECDPFYSEKNMAYLRESIAQMKEGKFVVKTMEELEAMEEEQEAMESA